jgi:6,7-dimethyl-8-ribityllumazine synthase
MQIKISPDNLSKIQGSQVAILQSKWHREYTDSMVAACTRFLKEVGCSKIEHHVLPGSMELPVAAKTLAQKGGYDALICFGAIIKGDTYHFELVSQECVRGLGAVALEFTLPVINEVLPCQSLDQLKARTADDEFNKGIEGAVAAIEMIAWRRKIKGL